LAGTLKKLAVISICGGVSFAVALGLMFWAVDAYRDRQKGKWNTADITAQFAELVWAEDDNHKPDGMIFTYTLENHTNHDYSVRQDDALKLFVKSSNNELVETGWDRVGFVPVLVPANTKVRVDLVSTFKYGDVWDYAAATYKTDEQKGLAKLVTSKRPQLSGFVLFDETHRVKIDMPKAW
jgi:hypothetical protein